MIFFVRIGSPCVCRGIVGIRRIRQKPCFDNAVQTCINIGNLVRQNVVDVVFSFLCFLLSRVCRLYRVVRRLFGIVGRFACMVYLPLFFRPFC